MIFNYKIWWLIISINYIFIFNGDQIIANKLFFFSIEIQVNWIDQKLIQFWKLSDKLNEIKVIWARLLIYSKHIRPWIQFITNKKSFIFFNKIKGKKKIWWKLIFTELLIRITTDFSIYLYLHTILLREKVVNKQKDNSVFCRELAILI